jgi:serine/threonine protein kinase
MLVGDLTLLKCLGKGAFGEVYLTSKQGTNQKYATKKIDKRFTQNPRAKRYLDNEISILQEIEHPNIIKLIEVHETSQYIYLVMELCNGGGLSDCLEDHMKKNKKPFSEEIVQYLMRQIVSGLNYLHKKDILHRDIKLDNILVNFDDEEDRKNRNMMKAKVKIIDFGFARHLEPSQLAYSTLGSPINMDPGILRKLNRMEHSKEYGYDQKADIWSLGTICYEMLIGKNTFNAENMRELISKVERGNYFLPTTISKEAVSFLNGMLQYDLKKRLSADQLENHKFLTKPYNELTKINLKEAKKNIIGSQLKINSKMNQSIWVIFETDENDDLDKVSPNMYEQNPSNNLTNNYLIGKNPGQNTNEKNIINKKNSQKIDESTLRKEFLQAFDIINEDCIYIEPKLIPIVPGDDPAVINKVSEFSEDNF